MSSSYEFWIPSNQNTSSSHYTSIGPGGVEYYGSPENLSNTNELTFGNSIKTQMGSTVNSYLGGYVANYTPYYMATILGGYQQTIMGLKSELVYGYKMEYKGTGKIEYNNATELSQKIGLTTLIHSAYTAVSSVFSNTTEEAREDFVGADFGLTIGGVLAQTFTEGSTVGVSSEEMFENRTIDADVQEQMHESLNIVSEDLNLTGDTLIIATGLALVG